jgi:hypothetical protein
MKAGLRIEDMVRSKWVYCKLRNFHAGIEAGISCLKRAYRVARCTWRGLDHFKTYVWSSDLAYNLVLFTRLQPTWSQLGIAGIPAANAAPRWRGPDRADNTILSTISALDPVHACQRRFLIGTSQCTLRNMHVYGRKLALLWQIFSEASILRIERSR